MICQSSVSNPERGCGLQRVKLLSQRWQGKHVGMSPAQGRQRNYRPTLHSGRVIPVFLSVEALSLLSLAISVNIIHTRLPLRLGRKVVGVRELG